MQMKSCASQAELSAAVLLSKAAALLCPQKMCLLFFSLQVVWREAKRLQLVLLALHDSVGIL